MMKFSYIILILYCLALSIPGKINALQDEKNVESNNPDMLRKGKTNSVEDYSNIIKGNVETKAPDMLRKVKKAKPARNCIDIKKQKKKSGVYLITPCDCYPSKVVKVYCDMDSDGGGWTVIQRRNNYTYQENFYNTWYKYALGFGDVSYDHWLGNDNIHCLTQQSHQEIRFDLEDFDGNSRYAKYEFFYVDDRSNLYKLGVEGYTGDAGDGFSNVNTMEFSTHDADNDIYDGNCAEKFKGGWWYTKCHSSNLNGLYLSGNHTSYADGVNWRPWKGYHYSLKKTEMKIREKN